MRRKRFQRGSLGVRKHGRVKVWVGQWREDGQKRSKVLGRVAQMNQTQAENLLAAILRPLNDGAGDHRKRRVHVPRLRRAVPSTLPTNLEGLDRGHVVADHYNARAAGVRRQADARDHQN